MILVKSLIFPSYDIYPLIFPHYDLWSSNISSYSQLVVPHRPYRPYRPYAANWVYTWPAPHSCNVHFTYVTRTELIENALHAYLLYQTRIQLRFEASDVRKLCSSSASLPHLISLPCSLFPLPSHSLFTKFKLVLIQISKSARLRMRANPRTARQRWWGKI